MSFVPFQLLLNQALFHGPMNRPRPSDPVSARRLYVDHFSHKSYPNDIPLGGAGEFLVECGQSTEVRQVGRPLPDPSTLEGPVTIPDLASFLKTHLNDAVYPDTTVEIARDLLLKICEFIPTHKLQELVRTQRVMSCFRPDRSADWTVVITQKYTDVDLQKQILDTVYHNAASFTLDFDLVKKNEL